MGKENKYIKANTLFYQNVFFLDRILIFVKIYVLGEKCVFAISENKFLKNKKSNYHWNALLLVRKLHPEVQSNISTNDKVMAN